VTRGAEPPLHERERDLEHDQPHDGPLDPQRPAVLQELQRGPGRLRDQGELAVQHGRPLADLEVVAEAGPEPLEFGMVPEQFR
jgi:hypothetical protein